MEITSLTAVPAGTECFVVGVDGDCPFLSRLRELGVEEGSALVVVRAAPALVVRLGETRIALRSDEAACVSVCTADAPVA
jgi:Fe2+ transport system protein FeoA